MTQKHEKKEPEVTYGMTYDIDKFHSKLVYVGVAQARPNNVHIVIKWGNKSTWKRALLCTFMHTIAYMKMQKHAYKYPL